MLNFIIDYDDMSRAGLVKTAEHSEQKYAIIIKFPKSKVGKFNIATKEATENSIYAIENNTIPTEIDKIARYYIKQAADHFGIETNWTVNEIDREIEFKNISFPKKTKTAYVVKIANEKFPLATITQLKLAEEYFIDKMHYISIPDRVKIATAIIKEGIFASFIPNSDVVEYAHPHLGNEVNSEIALRKHACKNNDKYITILNKVASIKDKMDPALFVEQIRQLDKAAGFNPERVGRSYGNFFTSTNKIDPLNIKNVIKIASVINDPNSEDLEKISKVL